MRNEQVGPHRDRMGGVWGSWGDLFLGGRGGFSAKRTRLVAVALYLSRHPRYNEIFRQVGLKARQSSRNSPLWRNGLSLSRYVCICTYILLISQDAGCSNTGDLVQILLFLSSSDLYSSFKILVFALFLLRHHTPHLATN